MSWLKALLQGYGQLFVRHPVLTGVSTLVTSIVFVAVLIVTVDSILHAITNLRSIP